LSYLSFVLPVIPPDSSDEELEGGDSSEDEEDDTCLQKALATSIGDVAAPDSSAIVDACPALATEQEESELVGKQVLYGRRVGHEKCGAGWFMRKVQRHGVLPRDLIRTPTANFVVAYTTRRKLRAS
jgi:hypothetical protein